MKSKLCYETHTNCNGSTCMKTQHTPGPWMNTPMQDTIWTADGMTKIATIADLPWNDGKSDWMTEQANARLIAAAPELLEALQACIEIVARVGTVAIEEGTIILRAQACLDQARAVIAKVQGT